MKERLRRVLLRAREIWLVLCMTLLYLALLEIALSFAYAWADRVRASSEASLDGRSRSDVYADVPWTHEYFRELEQSSVTKWTPYVYWRRQAYQGRHINIDANGIRRTWNANAPAGGGDDPVKIFTFGGSAMWGVGARDDFTIASCLAKDLESKGVRCRVTNFGESGYVSTQEVIALMQQLRDGNVPDLVIFYDGVNDIYSAYQQQKAGLPQNEFHRAQEFNVSQPRSYESLRILCIRRSIGSLAVVRFSRNILRKVGIEVDPRAAATYDSPPPSSAADREALFQQVLAAYRGNMRTVSILGEAYGFKALFYWQPTIFDKLYPTVDEQKVRQEIVGLQPYCETLCQLVQQKPFSGIDGAVFRDMSDVFSSARQPIFIDWCHVSEWGNEQVAGKMAADVVRLVGADSLASGRISNGSEPGLPGGQMTPPGFFQFLVR
ncbi:MAG: SGNH/GDSL hydrolase family protein [Solirubrobacterales bacterium]